MDYYRNVEDLPIARFKNSFEVLTDEVVFGSDEGEPITVAEFKDYARLAGYEDASDVTVQSPISITLLEGETSVQDDRLIDAVIQILAREGLVYTQALAVGNRKFIYNANGTISFLDPGTAGGNTIDIAFGYQNLSGIFNFTFDDTLIERCLRAAREYLEVMGNISIVPHEITALVSLARNRIKLDKGPVDSGVELKDSAGNVISGFTIIGNVYLSAPYSQDMVISYSTSPVDLEMVRLDILRLALALYENRGEKPADEIFRTLNLHLHAYSKTSFIA